MTSWLQLDKSLLALEKMLSSAQFKYEGHEIEMLNWPHHRHNNEFREPNLIVYSQDYAQSHHYEDS